MDSGNLTRTGIGIQSRHRTKNSNKGGTVTKCSEAGTELGDELVHFNTKITNSVFN